MGRQVDVEGLVSATDIAKRLGYSQNMVYHWMRGDRSTNHLFPRPVARVGKVLVWYWPDIEAWYNSKPVNRGGAPHGNTNNNGRFNGNQHVKVDNEGKWHNAKG